MKTRPLKRLFPFLLVCILLSCGMTALAADLYPADVQTVTGEGERQIIKTYILTDSEDPADIPRTGFTRDGWRYALTDITQKRVTATDTRAHTETVTINTETDAEATAETETAPLIPLLILVGVVTALLASGAVHFFLRHNVKVYAVGDTERMLMAKVRISTRNPTIDLMPLEHRTESRCFCLEIDKFTAKRLNNRTVDVVFGSARLQHKIAYEGNVYRIEADFRDMTIEAVYGKD